MRAADHRIVDGGTQSMVLSAAINNRLVCGAQGGTGSMLQSAAATNFAFPPSAQRTRLQRKASLPSAPRSSPGAEACRAIEADLGAISPGREAAGDGRGGLAEGERAY